MKKSIIFLIILLMSAGLSAQSEKKSRKTADNSAKNITARQISNRFNNGLRSYYTAQYDDAERIFSKILSENPKHAPSYFMLSKIYSANNLFSQSEDALKQAVKFDKNNIWYSVALGEIYLKTENYSKAAPIWESVTKQFPDNEIYLYNLYNCYYHLGNYPKMLATLNAIEENFGPSEEITHNKVIIFTSKNDVSAAINEYENLIKKQPYNVSNYLKAGVLCENYEKFDKALDFYTRAYQYFPENPEVNMMLANYWILRNDENQAEKHIAFLIPNPEIDIDKKMPFINKQIDFLDSSNCSKVENWAQQLILAHPDNSKSYQSLANVCYKTSKYSEAADLFEKTLKLDDSDVIIWSLFINSAEKSNKFNKILQFEDEITTLFPMNVSMLSALADAFKADKNAKKAVEYYKQALAYAYNEDEISLIYKGLYDSYLMIGDVENANKYSRK